jgi:uncharacterized protein
VSVFVDTSALYAALDKADPNHILAADAFDRLLGVEDLVTHNYVHVETEHLVRRRLGAAASRDLLEEMLPALRTVWVDETTHAEAVRALSGAGRTTSLVDQVSFLLMRGLEINVALAFDSDFERQGLRFPLLPRDPARHSLSEARAPYLTASDKVDLVSVAELAERSGRSVNTIQSWRRRHPDFPAPNAELAAGPIWLWRDVSAWIDRRSQRASGASGR